MATLVIFRIIEYAKTQIIDGRSVISLFFFPDGK